MKRLNILVIDGQGGGVGRQLVENIKKAIDTRLEDLKLAFENYVPGEMTKINNPVLVTKGTTVVLVLADDTASVSDQINELLK